MTVQVPVRRVFRIVNGGTPTSEPENWDDDVAWATPVDVGAAHGGYLDGTNRTLSTRGLISGSRSVPEGSLVISTRAPIGYVTIVTRNMAFNQGCRGLEPILDIDIRYFRYQFEIRSTELQSLGVGSTFMELSTEALANFRLWMPPVDHQRSIADFLDTETARIDALIARKQRLAGALNYRHLAQLESIVDGLSAPSAALGRFIHRLGQGTSPQAGSRPAETGEWGVLKLSAVKAGQFAPRENKTLGPNWDGDRSVIPRVGDLLVTRANTPDLVGDVCAVLAPVRNLITSDLIYTLRLDGRLLPEYAAYALRTSHARHQLSSVARGSSQSMVKLRGEDLKQVRIPVPTVERQADVVSMLDADRQRTSAVLARLKRQVALLREHREALISAAVSGELELPGVAA